MAEAEGMVLVERVPALVVPSISLLLFGRSCDARAFVGYGILPYTLVVCVHAHRG
jgi:hypothetical protein